MKVFTLRYEKNVAQNSMKRMQEAALTGIPHVRKDVLICDSYESMNRLLSIARLDIFVAIVEQHPDSMYALAQILKKDQSQVLRDAKILEEIGVINLVPVMKGNRERMKPEALYDKIVFEVTPKQVAQSA